MAEAWLIVGLGNPGPKYAGTRHNIGFMVLDRILADRTHVKVKALANGELYTIAGPGGEELHLLKPLTYMNASGVAVRETAGNLGIPSDRILVIYDCLDLPLGRLRFRRSGSSGGHRGVESVITELETSGFLRLRVGIGRPDCETIDYVLSSWSSTELPIVARAVDASAQATMVVVQHGIDAAMNSFNGWQAESESPARNTEPGDRTNEQV
jgi:PTH1 family peptidyl-tRNA hydrolase